MSVYSLDSLENERTSTLKIPDSLELCTGGSNETAEVARVNRSSSKNAIIASGENSAAAARQKEIQHQLPASGIPRKKLASAAPPPAAAAASRRLSGQNKRPESYLELYRRRFSAEASSSPEAAGLSICGDSSGRLHDAGAEEDVSRDDRSELSFYRRLLDETEAEAYQRRTSRDATCFRPYTIEDYRIIRATSAKLDRSLGPDREDVCAKRERLIRRRSYGDAASALNCQRISSASKKVVVSSSRNKRHPNKEKRLHDVSVATVQGPQSRRALEITEEPSSSSGVSKPAAIPSCRLNRQVVKRSCSTSTGPPRRCNQSANASSITRTRLQPGKSKEGGKVEASLQALRTRHFNEKRMIDQLVARAMLLRA